MNNKGNNNWIFLRGLTRGNIHWGNFPEVFKRLNPEAEIEFLEMPGNGLLNKESSPINPKEVIEFLKAKSKFCQKNLPFNICGISLGGMIALKWAELYPEDIASVTIINSSLKQYSPFYRRLITNNYGKIVGTLFKSDREEQEKIILSITSNKFHENQKYLKAFAELSRDHQVSRANFIRQLILASNIQIQNPLNVPLIVISSKHDRLVHSSCSDNIAKALRGNLYIHPTAGHDLPLDEPEWLSEILVRNS